MILRLAVRGAAIGAIGAALALPPLRRRLRMPSELTLATVVAAPVAVVVLAPRSRIRDVVLYSFHMWAFTIAHELPYDEPEALRRRLRVDYPIAVDRAIGRGRLPSVRLQRALAGRRGVGGLDRALAIVHWAWFFEPHVTLLYLQRRHIERFPGAARQMAATYDLGCLLYFAVPTAPPWWAAQRGRIEGGSVGRPAVRRIMVEVGERFWGSAWDGLYTFAGGNPWAAMPSLHFASSVMAALQLREVGRLEGAIGGAYAATLGFALVYLGEHYVTDLLAGAALVALVRRGEPLVEPLVAAINARLRRLERIAAG